MGKKETLAIDQVPDFSMFDTTETQGPDFSMFDEDPKKREIRRFEKELKAEAEAEAERIQAERDAIPVLERIKGDVEKKYEESGWPSPQSKISQYKEEAEKLKKKYEVGLIDEAQFNAKLDEAANVIGLTRDGDTIKVFPNEQELYRKEIDKAYSADAQAQAEREKDPFIKDVMQSLATGSAELLNSPTRIMAVTEKATNGVLGLMGRDREKDVNYFQDKAAIESQIVETAREDNMRFEGSIIEKVQSGNMAAAAAQTGLAVAENAPLLLALIMGNAAGATNATLGFMGGDKAANEYLSMESDTDTKEIVKIMNAVGKGFSEVIWESMGTVSILNGVKKAVATQGAATVRDQMVRAYTPMFERHLAILMKGTSDMAKEGASEMATELTDNLLDWANDKTVKVWDGVADAGIVGAVIGGPLGAGSAINQLKGDARLKEIRKIVDGIPGDFTDAQKLDLAVNYMEGKPLDLPDLATAGDDIAKDNADGEKKTEDTDTGDQAKVETKPKEKTEEIKKDEIPEELKPLADAGLLKTDTKGNIVPPTAESIESDKESLENQLQLTEDKAEAARIAKKLDVLNEYKVTEVKKDPVKEESVKEEISEEEKALFPESKSQDVLYHGSPHEIESFDSNKQGPSKGFFFSDSPEHAAKFAKKGNNPGNVSRVRLDMKNPLITKWESKGLKGETKAELVARAKKAGHDGLIIETEDLGIKIKEHIVFDKSQIHVIGQPIIKKEKKKLEPAKKEQAKKPVAQGSLEFEGEIKTGPGEKTKEQPKKKKEKTEFPPEGSSPQQVREWVADNSSDAKEIHNAWAEEKTEIADAVPTPVEEQILEHMASKQSFIDNSDETLVGDLVEQRWFRKDGKPLDKIAAEVSAVTGKEVSVEDVVETMLNFPNGRSRTTSELQRNLEKRYADVTGRKIAEFKDTAKVDVVGKRFKDFIDEVDPFPAEENIDNPIGQYEANKDKIPKEDQADFEKYINELKAAKKEFFPEEKTPVKDFPDIAEKKRQADEKLASETAVIDEEQIFEKPDLIPSKSLKGKMVKMEVEVEETGNKVTHEMGASEVHQDIERRLDIIEKLTDCIG